MMRRSARHRAAFQMRICRRMVLLWDSRRSSGGCEEGINDLAQQQHGDAFLRRTPDSVCLIAVLAVHVDHAIAGGTSPPMPPVAWGEDIEKSRRLGDQ
jgi:hypothetical protein